MATDLRGRKLPKGIRQRYENSYEGRFTKDGISYSVTGRTITETQKAMNDMKYKLEHGMFVQKEKITFDDWFETWITEYKENSVKQGTVDTHRNHYRAYIQPTFGNVYLTNIRGEHIQKLYNDLYKNGLSASTIKQVSATLNCALKQAQMNGLIENNPTQFATLPKGKPTEKKEALTREQQAIFEEYAKDSYLHNFFAILLRTGMRCGELRGLKYSDIDRKAGVIHVRRTLNAKAGGGLYEDTPKTKTSMRDIPLTPDIISILNNQKAEMRALFNIMSIDGYIFLNESGNALTEQVVVYFLNRITKKIEDDGHEMPHTTPHTFRHTFATRCIEAGMNPQTLKTILGHSSLSMTMDLYSHVLPDTKSEEMQKVANVFN